jgi:hypothetical protein
MQYHIVVRRSRARQNGSNESWLKSLQTMHDIERYGTLSLQRFDM